MRKIVILSILIFPLNVFAYSVGTHAFLTQELVEFYNQQFPERQIPEEFEDEIIEGSRREDDLVRWMNHFYDPVNNRGLTAVPGNWLSSKEWSRSADEQVSALYNPIVNTTIADLLAVTNPMALRETDFTWERAIQDYVKGDRERAFRALGQVLHLIEDASVPDHTRNDPHPAFDDHDALGTGSPYEIWTKNFNLSSPDNNLPNRLSGKKPVMLGNLEEYFDGLATYSNNNFYSKDTIGMGEYSSPEPTYIWREEKIFYGFRKDEDGNYYHLVSYKNDPKDVLWAQKGNLDLRDKQGDRVLNDYWNRLSVKSIQYGAGVVNLFFKEVEKAQKDPNFVIEEPKSLFAQAVEVVGGFFKNLFQNNQEEDSGLNLVAEIDLNDQENSASPERSDNLARPDDLVEELVSEEALADEPEAQESEEALDEELEEAPEDVNQETLELEEGAEAEEVLDPPTQENSADNFQVCTFATSQSASRNKLLINEVAWAGTAESSSNEWIELKNISGGELDISNWQLLDEAEQIKVTFPSGTKVASGGFVLLERTDDNSVPGVAADIIYTGALSNSNEGLRLFDPSCQLIDEVSADSSWPAGDSSTRRTMERSADLTWHTYNGSGESGIFGTPKKENSQLPTTSGGSPSPAENAQASANLNILISEAQITGSGGSKDEFVELYNPNSASVDLTGWYVKRKSSSGNEYSLVSAGNLSGKTIPAKGYFLLAHPDYSGSVAADVTWPSSYAVSADNTVILYKSDGSVSDKLGFGSAADYETSPYSDNPASGQTLSRESENDTDNNAADFELTTPSPKNSSTSGGFLAIQAEADSSNPANHPVISELFINMAGSDDQEFIEIYNPTSQQVSLSGWSLQYLSGGASTMAQIAKKNFTDGASVQPLSYYLIGVGGYSSSTAADMTWSQSLNNTGATVFLVASSSGLASFDSDEIIDKVAYGSASGGELRSEGAAALLPPEGQSLERKANTDNSCLSILDEENKFSGNACDRDNNSKDWEAQSLPNPQNSQSFPEPRTAPTAPDDFSAAYDSPNMIVNLSWSPSQDYASSSSAVNYVLSYATSTNSLIQLAEVTATTTYSASIKEVGIGHAFSITAKDRDGLPSASSSSVSLNVPSLYSNFSFYKDTRAASSTKYLLDFYYNNYPFAPDVYDNGDAWKILVFYLNSDAPDEVELNAAGNWNLENPGVALGVAYGNCASGNENRYSLILPDTSARCSNGGGVENEAMHWDNLEDLHLLVELSTTTADATFTNQDFVTVGAYSLQSSGGGDQKFKLAALDRTKRYFQSDTPAHQSPDMPDNFELSFNQSSSLLRIIWDRSRDGDTLDSLIDYEIKYTTGDLDSASWIDAPEVSPDSGENSEIGGRPFTKISVESDTLYNLAVRAKDDFGNYSVATTTSYQVPEIAPPYGISNIQWGYINSSSTIEISFSANAYPFMTAGNSSAILFFLNQSPPSSYSFSNSSDRWAIGGSNKVLKLKYSTCQYGVDELLGGLLMHNSDQCPNGGSGLKKNAVRNDLASGQTSFGVEVIGVLENEGSASHTFSADDYLTMGFYELQGNSFQAVSSHNEKIYFSE